jgi:hypothetical protein
MERLSDSGKAYEPISMTTIFAKSLTEDGMYCRLMTHMILGRTQAPGRSFSLIGIISGLVIATVKRGKYGYNAQNYWVFGLSPLSENPVILTVSVILFLFNSINRSRDGVVGIVTGYGL